MEKVARGFVSIKKFFMIKNEGVIFCPAVCGKVKV